MLEVDLDGRSELNVELSADVQALDDIVVVGYGTQRRANLTGSVDHIGSEEFENRSVPNLSQGLQGMVPNLNIQPLDGKPTESPSINIRGTTSIDQEGDALILIDREERDGGMLNPNDIESISDLEHVY